MIIKKLTWFGHNCFLLECNDARFLIDPFFTDKTSTLPENLLVDYILVSHGHSDHCADVLKVAKHSNATVVAIAEITDYFSRQGLKTEPINIGGIIYPQDYHKPLVPQIQILAVPALHSSTLPNGESGGQPLGFVISISQNRIPLSPPKTKIQFLRKILSNADAFSIYFACDTGFFSDMRWIGSLGIDAAVLPIGNRYTMGASMSLDAIALLNPKNVIPSHYNTWSPIEQNVQEWAEAVKTYTQANPVIMDIDCPITQQSDTSWK